MGRDVDAVIDRLRNDPLFPFTGDLVAKEPGALLDAEPVREGENGAPCQACRNDDRVLWRNERWRISTIRPSANPVGLFLETVEHLDFEHFDDDLAREFGLLTVHLEAAIRSLGTVGRVHVHRWGDGAEHFHVWFQGRPARRLELVGWGNVIWSQVLDPLSSDELAANHAQVIEHLVGSLGGADTASVAQTSDGVGGLKSTARMRSIRRSAASWVAAMRRRLRRIPQAIRSPRRS